MNPEPLISVRDLHQKIGRQEILRGFSLDIFKGKRSSCSARAAGARVSFCVT